jgi:hypothetical protein
MGSDTEDDDAGRPSARLSSVPLFKGVKSSFPDWARRFVATCEQRNCADAPEIDALTNLPSDPKEESSRPDIINATRDLDRFMSAPTSAHLQALKRNMSYVVQTPERGWVLHPDTGWDGTADHEFVFLGRCDASYKSCPDTGRSVSGWSIF